MNFDLFLENNTTKIKSKTLSLKLLFIFLAVEVRYEVFVTPCMTLKLMLYYVKTKRSIVDQFLIDDCGILISYLI